MSSSMNPLKFVAAAFSFVAVVGLTVSRVEGQVHSFRTVALSGEQAAGLPAGLFYYGLDAPLLNDAGQTAFSSNLTGAGVTTSNNLAVFTEGGGSGLAAIARKGDQAAGLPAGLYYSSFLFGTPTLNDVGQLAFRSDLGGPGVTTSNNLAIFSEGGGLGLTAIAREGDQAAGLPLGVDYLSLGLVSLNNAGQTAFGASLTGVGVNGLNNTALYREGGGSGPTPIARKGDQVAGLPAGVNYSSFGFTTLNNAGQIAFRAKLTGAAVTSSNDAAILSEGGGSGLTPIARKGDQAAGLSAGVNYSNFFSATLNDAGRMVFGAGLTGAGVTVSNGAAIFGEGGGSGLAPIVRAGDQAAGLPAGVNYFGLNVPVLNNAGQIAFQTFLTGAGVTNSNDTAIFSEGGGLGMTAIAREGDQAAGLPAGVNYSNLFSPMLNDRGQTAFFATLSDGSSGFDGIFATDPLGELLLVAVEGALFDVNPDPLIDDLRTIEFLEPNFDFNNAGELALSVRFTDGTTGVFVATVPEPGAAGLLTLGALIVARRRWCRASQEERSCPTASGLAPRITKVRLI